MFLFAITIGYILFTYWTEWKWKYASGGSSCYIMSWQEKLPCIYTKIRQITWIKVRKCFCFVFFSKPSFYANFPLLQTNVSKKRKKKKGYKSVCNLFLIEVKINFLICVMWWERGEKCFFVSTSACALMCLGQLNADETNTMRRKWIICWFE